MRKKKEVDETIVAVPDDALNVTEVFPGKSVQQMLSGKVDALIERLDALENLLKSKGIIY
jgi:inorganic pyrophosphatase